MVCLNAVETLVNNHCSDLAVVLLFRAGGALFPQRCIDLKTMEVSALSVLLWFLSFYFIVSSSVITESAITYRKQ